MALAEEFERYDMMEQRLDNEQINRLWQHIAATQSRFDTRLNFFLIFESVLIGVAGILYSRPIMAKIPLLFIICLGILLTAIWQYIQARERYILDDLESKLLEVSQEYRETVARRERVKWPIGTTALLAFGVPPLVVLIWIAFLIVVLAF